MVKRLIFWFEWHYYLRCKHFCVGCKYYEDCKREVEDILDMSKTF